MTDIVESERTAGYWLGYHDGEKSGRSEAAAEIERLRAWNREIALNAREFAAENERLRAALEVFACDCIESGDLCPSPQNCRNYIARAALEGK